MEVNLVVDLLSNGDDYRVYYIPFENIIETQSGEFILNFCDNLGNRKTIRLPYIYIQKPPIGKTSKANIHIKEKSRKDFDQKFEIFQVADKKIPSRQEIIDIVIEKKPPNMKFRVVYDGQRCLYQEEFDSKDQYYMGIDNPIGHHTLAIECICDLPEAVPTDKHKFWGFIEFDVRPSYEKERFHVKLLGEGEHNDRYARTPDGCYMMIEVTNTCDVRYMVEFNFPNELGFSFDSKNVVDCGYLEHGKRNYVYILYSKNPKSGKHRGSLSIKGDSYPFEFEVFETGTRDTRSALEKPFDYSPFVYHDGNYPKIVVPNEYGGADHTPRNSKKGMKAVTKEGKTLWSVDFEHLHLGFEFHEYKNLIIVSRITYGTCENANYSIACYDRQTGKLLWEQCNDPAESAYGTYPYIFKNDKIFSTNPGYHRDSFDPYKMPVYDIYSGKKLNAQGYSLGIGHYRAWLFQDERKIVNMKEDVLVWERSIYNYIGDGQSYIMYPLSENGGVIELITSYGFAGDGRQGPWYIIGIRPEDGSIAFGCTSEMNVDVDGRTGRMFNRNKVENP